MNFKSTEPFFRHLAGNSPVNGKTGVYRLYGVFLDTDPSRKGILNGKSVPFRKEYCRSNLFFSEYDNNAHGEGVALLSA
ncbi:hypothetical protein MSLAZ_2958 [Methanosarcina lacustris Z-7289]|uniref:Uncharacterized protein n=1 Tax=Methanosarcina lacustris Z-7289 TaxID=1434111 RepID=A0A0E3S548_9EURY|nr:hypothetical protein MSLAZ_2958 [Methanosarcina lacustris Z-7289]